MVWGMTTSTFTLVHVWLSVIGMGAGLVVVLGLLAGKSLGGWTALFLITTAATSVTGFAFPFDHLLPSHKVGIVSLAVLALALLARYGFRLTGPWRRVYAVGVGLALYLNVFVAVVQAFEKVPFLNAMAPTQTEPAFVVTQVVVLALFTVLTIGAAQRFRKTPVRPA
jgi:hypothetical protein